MQKFIRLCALICVLFAFWSCEKPLTQPAGDMAIFSKNAFSVDEAKQWFELEVSLKAVKSSRINGAWNKELVWEFVNNIDSGGVGQVMIVPIHFKEGMPLISVGKEFTPSDDRLSTANSRSLVDSLRKWCLLRTAIYVYRNQGSLRRR